MAVVIPKPPLTAKMFPMLMMMGVMILLAAFIISIVLGFIAADYWNHSIATELNTAPAGSELLRQLGQLNAVNAWLTPFKFVGIAVLFTGIALALVTIVTVLQAQTKRVVEIVETAKAR